MKNNIEIYEDIKQLLGLNQTEFATDYCQKSESYIRVLRNDPEREIPTEVLANIWDKIESVKALQPQTMKKALSRLQEKIAREILYRNTSEQHKKLREMLINIVESVNAKKHTEAMPIIIM